MEKSHKPKRKKGTTTTSRYITNKQLMPEMIKFKETGVMSEELGGMILEIAMKITYKGCFSGYHGGWKVDMIGESLVNIMKYLHNFNPNHPKANAFAYISQCIHNAFKNSIKKNQRHSQLKDDLFNCRFELYEETGYTLKAIDYESLKKFED